MNIIKQQADQSVQAESSLPKTKIDKFQCTCMTYFGRPCLPTRPGSIDSVPDNRECLFTEILAFL